MAPPAARRRIAVAIGITGAIGIEALAGVVDVRALQLALPPS
jgi:hypothetical protein